MGRGSSKASRKSESINVSGDYKATQEMIDTAMSIAKDIQKEFPVLDKTFDIKFSKYMGSSAGMGFGDRVEINGAYFKRLVNRKDTDEIRGLIAHELTHTMQSRLSEGLRGDAKSGNTERIWNNAVKKYISDNPGKTIKDVNNLVASRYGGGGHSRYGKSPTELMAVAVENVYSNGHKDVSNIGRYVISELKKEMRK